MDVKKQVIDRFERQVVRVSALPEHPGLLKASVLVPLFVKDGELHAWLTLRSEQLRTNAGEVCFPGGKSDPSDKDEVCTALREAQEEIGVRPDQVEVVGRLHHPIVSKGGLLVTAVVGFVDASFRPCPNPAEVSAVFAVPLRLFLEEKDHSTVVVFPGGRSLALHNFQFLDPDSGHQYRIWGMTAAIGILVAVLALGERPEFDIDKVESVSPANSGTVSKL